jgi:hypothetical protein
MSIAANIKLGTLATGINPLSVIDCTLGAHETITHMLLIVPPLLISLLEMQGIRGIENPATAIVHTRPFSLYKQRFSEPFLTPL